ALDMQSGEPVKFSLAYCEFGYRESVFKKKFKDQYFITAVSLRLAKLSSPKTSYRFKTEYGDIQAMLSAVKAEDITIKAVSDAVCRIRNSKLPDPKVIGNAGSFFKNPSVSADKFNAL